MLIIITTKYFFALQIAKEGIPKNDPSQLSGDLANIVGSSDEESEDEEDGSNRDKKETADRVYKIPKISQTHYRKYNHLNFIIKSGKIFNFS